MRTLRPLLSLAVVLIGLDALAQDAVRITDIAQKGGFVRFTLSDFDMERVSALYAKSEYKGRLKVEAAAKPCLSLKLPPKARVIDLSRKFIADWASTGSQDVIQ